MTEPEGARFLHPGPEFRKFVRSYQHTAFRLEVRDRYAEAGETDEDESWMDDWTGMILRRTLAGQRMQRVRVVSQPWSEYTRFGLHLSRLNVAAGEDIRYLDRGQVSGLDLPGYDFWLIDAYRLCIMRFDDDDVLLGADVVDDPAVVLEHCHARERALHHAIPRAEYLTQHGGLTL